MFIFFQACNYKIVKTRWNKFTFFLDRHSGHYETTISCLPIFMFKPGEMPAAGGEAVPLHPGEVLPAELPDVEGQDSGQSPGLWHLLLRIRHHQ